MNFDIWTNVKNFDKKWLLNLRLNTNIANNRKHIYKSTLHICVRTQIYVYNAHIYTHYIHITIQWRQRMVLNVTLPYQNKTNSSLLINLSLCLCCNLIFFILSAIIWLYVFLKMKYLWFDLVISRTLLFLNLFLVVIFNIL